MRICKNDNIILYNIIHKVAKMMRLKKILIVFLMLLGLFLSFNAGYMMGWYDECYLCEVYLISTTYTSLVDIEKGNFDELKNEYERRMEIRLDTMKTENGFLDYILREGITSCISALLGMNDSYPSCLEHFETAKTRVKAFKGLEKTYRSFQGER